MYLNTFVNTFLISTFKNTSALHIINPDNIDSCVVAISRSGHLISCFTYPIHLENT